MSDVKTIEQEMDAMAERMEKSVKAEADVMESLKATIRELGADGLKKALPTLTDTQRATLEAVLEDMKKGGPGSGRKPYSGSHADIHSEIARMPAEGKAAMKEAVSAAKVHAASRRI